MQKVLGVAISLCGATLGGCGNLAGLSVVSPAPERISVIKRPTEPVIHYGGSSSPDDRSEFVDPVPRYLARAGLRQAALSPPRMGTARTPAAQIPADPATTGAAAQTPADPATTGAAAQTPADPVTTGGAAQTRADPATTGAAASRPPTGDAAPESLTGNGSSLSPEEQERLTAERERLNAQRRAEAMRAMNERIAARDREVKRSLSGICTGCQ